VDAPVVDGAPGIDVLNFQGSKGNNCVTSDGSCPNLNAMHGHDVHVVALDGDKLKPREDQRKGGNGFGINEEGAGYTLTGVDRHGVAYKSECFENHAQDSRIKPIEVSDTRNQKDGTGGNNLPLVCFSKVSHPTAPNGEGERWDEREVAQTRNTFDNGEKRCQEVVVSMAQNTRDEVRIIGGDGQIAGALPAEPGMKQQTYIVSTNSNGGDVAATLTQDLAKPTLAQSQFGDVAGCLTHRTDSSPCADRGQNVVATCKDLSQMRYIVRRLTPTECERLMGLPDGYTIPAGLDANDPALVAEFQRIHDTFGAIMAEYEHVKPPKPKTAAQVQKWLAKITDPATCPDSPRYKACGNGWATNQPRWILTRLLNAEDVEW
jgi:site-specific DNA-cytosine methylase